MTIKILNLYAGIGGNRKLWDGDIEVTAVELDEKIANIYQDFFPQDKVIVADAHKYLLDNYKEYDFIWSSPPCPSHSQMRYNLAVRFRGSKAEYPNMFLYQEVIFLMHHFDGKWSIENVRPYYDYLIEPTAIIQRHPIWCNFELESFSVKQENLRAIQIPELQQLHGFDLSKYKIKDKRKLLRNCVDSKLGKHIFDCAFKHRQGELFN